jgi:hypothetical protein
MIVVLRVEADIDLGLEYRGQKIQPVWTFLMFLASIAHLFQSCNNTGFLRPSTLVTLPLTLYKMCGGMNNYTIFYYNDGKTDVCEKKIVKECLHTLKL